MHEPQLLKRPDSPIPEKRGSGETPPVLKREEVPTALDAVRALTAYEPGPPDPRIDLLLDENEGPPPPQSTIEALRHMDPELIRRYPSINHLRELLAHRHGVEPERVFVSAGVDEALNRTCRAFLEPGREIILPTPTFEMLVRYVRLSGAEPVTVPWPRGPYPTEQVLGAITGRTAAIAFVSPNNPTGAAGTRQDLQRIAAAATRALIMVDLAYAEFADEDLTSASVRLPNTLTFRTFSKAWGMAGLRVGYAIGPRPVIEALRISGPAYPVGGLSIALAVARLLHDADPVRAYVARVRAEREQLSYLLAQLGADPVPSQANFVLAFFGDAPGVGRSLLSAGIAVHGFAAGTGLEKALRITCPGDAPSFQRLCEVLRRRLA